MDRLILILIGRTARTGNSVYEFCEPYRIGGQMLTCRAEPQYLWLHYRQVLGERSEDDLNNLGNLGYLQRERENSPGSPNNLRKQLAEHLFHFGLLEDGPLPSIDETGQIIRITRNERIIGKSLPLLRSLRAARKAASAPGYSLLLGPIGSGKELFCNIYPRSIELGQRSYETLNCAAIPDTLIESELFGHEKGAFTDAAKQKLGRFEMANRGTIFLDEIGYMSSGAQTRLLRVLEGGYIQRLGGTSTIKVDVKVVAATNQNLQMAVKEGLFKGDLLSRIKHYEIRIPSLNERPDDIKLLFDYFLEIETNNIEGAIWPKRIDSQVYELLGKRSWESGNVRQLRKTVASIASDRRFSQSITPNDISPDETFGPSHERTGDPSKESQEIRVLVSLTDAEAALREAHISSSQVDLNGTLTSLQRAYGEVVMRLLEIALVETKAVSGELRPTTAIKLLLGREKMSAPQAASYLLTLSKLFPLDPVAESDLGRAISWAATRRRTNSRSRTAVEDGI